MKKLLPALLITLALVLAHETAQAQFGFGKGGQSHSGSTL